DDVHSPFFPPKALRDESSKKELYLGVTKAMDEQLSEMFDYVRNSAALRDNTIIVVASDNGPEPGAGSAGELRGTKGMLYEGGIRDPFIVWAPGLMPKSAKGKVNDTTVVSALDFFPSMARIAGVSLPKEVVFEGEDLSAALLGKSRKNRSQPIFWNRPPDRPGEEDDRWPDLAMRDKNWKLLLMHDGSNTQLYDLSKDPGETRNVAGENPKVVARMSKSLLEWWKTLPETKMVTAKKRN
ncbi:MAG: sulfatase, partial [Limisphaerales bacterium]